MHNYDSFVLTIRSCHASWRSVVAVRKLQTKRRFKLRIANSSTECFIATKAFITKGLKVENNSKVTKVTKVFRLKSSEAFESAMVTCDTALELYSKKHSHIMLATSNLRIAICLRPEAKSRTQLIRTGLGLGLWKSSLVNYVSMMTKSVLKSAISLC